MHITASPETHVHVPEMMCGNSNWQKSNWWGAEAVDTFWGGPYQWGGLRSASYLYKRSSTEKLSPDGNDKIEKMKHKSFLVYLLVQYVIGWK